MVRQGSKVNYFEDNLDEGDFEEDHSDDDDYGHVRSGHSKKKMAAAKANKKKTIKSISKAKMTKKRGPRGKISKPETPVSKRNRNSQVFGVSPRARKHVSYTDEDQQSDEDDEDNESVEEESESEDEGMSRGRGRKPKVTKGRRPKASHAVARKSQNQTPPVSEMVIESIKALKDNPRKGSTLSSIKQTISLNWSINMNSYESKIKKFILKAIEKGDIIQTRGHGFRGRFTVPGMKVRKKKKKTVLTKKFDEEVEEYHPSKTVRDEERERNQEELERKREENKEARIEERRIQKQLEDERKANKPKKKIVRRTEYEVEAIKGKKTLKGNLFYLVKFKGWSKPQWEPEENVSGCEEVIQEFEREQEEKLREDEERRRREEEEGAYEVKKIIEVKFLRSGKKEFLIRWVGHGPEDDSWEPEENLNCPELIKKFMAGWEKVHQVSEKNMREARKPVERLMFAKPQSRSSKRHGGFRVTYEGMDD